MEVIFIPKIISHKEFIDEMKIKRPDITVLGTYINSSTKIKFKHNCGYIWDTTPSIVRRTKSCPLCGNTLKKTKDQFIYELSKVTDTISVVGDYKSRNKKIDCKCLICDNIFSSTPSNLLSNHGCPYCSGRKVYEDTCLINTHPYIKDYLCDINDGYKYKAGSHKHIDFKCPNCGTIRNLTIKNVINQGFSCTYCDDKLSYPNKYARNLLKQLPVENIHHEYSTNWSEHYRYDNYFEYIDKKYILEMDGYFHFKYNTISGQTKEESQEIDKIKDNLALKNNIEVIRIDCRKSEPDYIKKSILSSKLNELFDLSIVDWSECNAYASNNFIKEVCIFYQNNKTTMNREDVSKYFSISKYTLSRYIKIGKNVGWIKNDIEDTILRSMQVKNQKSVKVDVFDVNTMKKIFEFKSINLCSKQLTKNEGVTYCHEGIRRALNSNSGIYKNYIFRHA